MLQANFTFVSRSESAPSPVVVLAQRLEDLKRTTTQQLARDRTDYQMTILELRKLNEPEAKYIANPSFRKLGVYTSVVTASEIDPRSAQNDALQIVRYKKYLEATEADRKNAALQTLYGAQGIANKSDAEKTVEVASLYPDIKNKMDIVNLFGNDTIKYDFEKLALEEQIRKNLIATDDNGLLFNWFGSAERTERSRLGICVDSAFEKMDLLIRSGVPAKKIGVIILHWQHQAGTPTAQDYYHAVTVVEAEDGLYILNNDKSPPQRADKFFMAEFDKTGARAVPVICIGEGGMNIYNSLPQALPVRLQAVQPPHLARPTGMPVSIGMK